MFRALYVCTYDDVVFWPEEMTAASQQAERSWERGGGRKYGDDDK